MVMVLNDDGDRYVERFKPVEDVRAVILSRLDERALFDCNWHFPAKNEDVIYQEFLDSQKNYAEVIRDVGLPGDTSRQKIITEAYLSVIRREKRRAALAGTKRLRDEIETADSAEKMVELLSDFNVFDLVDDDDEICEECVAFRARFTSQSEITFVENSCAAVNSMWFLLGRDCAVAEFDRVVRLFEMEHSESDTPFTATLGSSLKFCRQDFPVRLGADVRDRTALDVIAHAVHAFWMPVDRSGTLPTPGVKMSAEPIPDATGFTDTLDDVMLAEAQRIWNLNREFRVYWSGGIDSTGVLVALLRTAQTDDLERMTIVYSTDDPYRSSVAEYPKFFADHIDGKLNKFACHAGPRDRFFGSPTHMLSSFVGNDIAHHAQSGVLCVTGELGDQMFGSAAFSADPDLINMTTRDYLKRDDFQAHLEDIKRFNDACPTDTTKLVDCLWWWNYAVKWAEVRYRAAVAVEDGNALQNVHAFFGGEDFQKWSIANSDKKIKDTPESYKFALKDFIYDFTGDADYRDTKLKEGSLRVRVGAMAAIDDRNNIIKFGDTSTSETLMQQRFGDSLKKFCS
jgi:hypothetical protein